MKNNYKKLAVLAAFVFAASVVNAQNVGFATNNVSINVAEVIGIVDAGNNLLPVGTEVTAQNLGNVVFSYPTTAAYQAPQTVTGGTFNVSASRDFVVRVRAEAANFTSTEVADVEIPVTVLNITGTGATGVLFSPIAAGELTTEYQPFATGGLGAVMPVSPSYTISSEEARANIFGVPAGIYTVDVFYQVSAL